MVELREIFYANLTVTHKGNKLVIKKVVYKPTDGFYKNIRVLSEYGIKDKIKVDKFEIIKSLGFENPALSKFTEVVKSDEKRNKIGAYE